MIAVYMSKIQLYGNFDLAVHIAGMALLPASDRKGCYSREVQVQVTCVESVAR